MSSSQLLLVLSLVLGGLLHSGSSDVYEATISVLPTDQPRIGGVIHRKCMASPKSANWNFRWQTPKGKVIFGDTLNLKIERKEQFGKYTCIAADGNSRLVASTLVEDGVAVKWGAAAKNNGRSADKDAIDAGLPDDRKKPVINLRPTFTKSKKKTSVSRTTGGGLDGFVNDAAGMSKIDMKQGTSATQYITLKIVAQSGESPNIGGRVRRLCKASAPGFNIYWLYPNGRKVYNPLLSLDNIGPRDAGTYFCYARRGDVEMNVKFSLNFGSDGGSGRLPKISVVPLPGDNFVVGGTLRRECRVSEPGWYITWTYPNGDVVNEAVLLLQGLSQKHGGRYKCIAKKRGVGQLEYTLPISFTTKTKTKTLQIWYMVRVTIIAGAKERLSLGGSLSRLCLAPGSDWRVKWRLPSGVVIPGSLLNVDNLSRSKMGEYLCMASDGRGQTAATILMVEESGGRVETWTLVMRTERDERLEENGLLHRRCVPPDPSWGIRWRTPGDRSISSPVIRVDNLSKRDIGMYECVATRGSRTLRHRFYLQLGSYSARPTIKVPSLPTEKLEFGGTLSRECRVSEPGWTIKWTYPNGTVINSPFIVVSDLSQKHEGNYKCVAMKAGRGRMMITLPIRFRTELREVVVTVGVSVRPGQNNRPYLGGVLSRICSSTGKNWEVKWISPSGVVIPGPQLTLDRLSRNQMGRYICTAIDENGKKVETILIVEESGSQVETRSLRITTMPGERLVSRGILHRRCIPPDSSWGVYWKTPGGGQINSPVLRVDNLSQRHIGLYECVATRRSQTLRASINLDFTTTTSGGGSSTTLRIVELPGDVTTLGGVLKRECVSSQPGWNIVWRHPDGKITNGGVLYINGLNLRHAGRYLCIATKDGIRKEMGLKIEIREQKTGTIKVNAILIRIAGDENLAINGRFHRYCEVTGSGWRIEWKSPRKEWTQGSELLVDNLRRSDMGEYMCRATKVDNGNTMSVMMIVKLIGGQVELQILTLKTLPDENLKNGVLSRECVAPDRSWRVYWIKPNGDKVNSAVIRVVGLSIRDAGKYRCEAVRGQDKLDLSFDLFVGQLGIKPVASIKIETLPEEKLTYGGSLQRLCIVDQAGWDVYWILPNNDRINGPYLTRMNLRSSDSGTYTCYGKSLSTGKIISDKIAITIRKAKLTIRTLPGDRPIYGGMIHRKCVINERGWVLQWTRPDGVTIPDEIISISNLQQSRSGVYTCIARNPVSKAVLTTSFSINIIDPIQPPSTSKAAIKIIRLEDERLKYDGMIHRQCKVNETGWLVFWTRPNGTKIENPFLKIRSLRPTDNGEYTCYARNPRTGGTLSAWFIVNIPGRDTASIYIEKEPDDRNEYDGRISRICKVTRPGWTIYWIKPDESRIYSDRIVIPRLRPTDNGNYKCFARNPSTGSTQYVWFTVSVSEPTTEATIVIKMLPGEKLYYGGILKRRCEVDKPGYAIKWRKPDGRIIRSRDIILTDLRESQNGRYTCIATKGLSMLEKSFQVNLEPPPRPREIIIRPLPGDNLVYKGMLNRICEVDEEGWSIVWTFPNRTRLDSNIITIRNLRPMNNGRYTCYARKPSTGATLEMWLSVYVRGNSSLTYLTITSLVGENIATGGTLRRLCTVNRDGWTVSWRRPNGQIVNKNTLIITDLKSSDVGRYTCIARKGQNSISTYMMLELYDQIHPGNPTYATLKIIPQPGEVLQVQGRIRRLCTISLPGFRIHWIYPNGRVDGNPLLEVNDISERDGGTYTCVATRDRYRLNSTFTVTFTGKPNTKLPRLAIRILPGEKLEFGGVMQRRCMVNRRGWTIYWTMANGTRLDSQYIAVHNLRPINSGVYTCHAVNSLTGQRVSLPTYILIKNPVEMADIFIRSLPGENLKEGGSVRRQCVVSQDGWTVSWNLPNGTIVKDQYLILRDLRASTHNGHYTCRGVQLSTGATLTTWFSVNVPGGKPIVSITITPGKTEILQPGGRLDRNCVVSGGGYDKIQWKTPSGWIQKSQLIVNNLNQKDFGEYVCTATDTEGNSMIIVMVVLQEGVRVKTYVLTMMILPTEDLKENGVLFRKCVAPDRSWNVYWTKPNNERVRDAILRVTGLSKRDIGLYQCIAERGRDTLKISFRLRSLPSIIKPNVNMTAIVIQPGAVEKLTPGGYLRRVCSVTGRGWTVQWRTPTGRVIRSGRLDLDNLGQHQMGQYVCTARHPSGVTLTSYLVLGISGPRVRARSITMWTLAGEKLKLNGSLHRRCLAPNRKWSVYWQGPNGLKVNGPVLRVDKLSQRDSGLYECVARLGRETVRLSFRMKVAIPEDVAWISIHRFPGENFKYGGTLYRECRVTKPGWKISWRYPDGRKSDMSQIYIVDLTEKHAGTYVCEATKGDRRLTVAFDLYFRMPPGPGPDEPARISVKRLKGDNFVTGGTVLRECVVSKPGWKIVWHYPNGTVSTSPVLHINPLIKKYAGSYRCVATKDRKQLQVEIQIKLDGGGVTESYIVSALIITVRPGRNERPVIGGEIIRTCFVGGDDWTYKWLTPSGREITGPQLSLTNLRANEMGKYVCTATDKFGKTMQYILILENKDGRVNTRGLQIKTLPGENLAIDGVLHRLCEAPEGKWYVFWRKPNGERVSNAVLRMDGLSERDAGNYECVATYGSLTISQSFGLTLYRSSGDVRVNLKTMPGDNVKMGGVVNRKCEVSEPGWNIGWRYPDGRFQPGGSLVINRISMRDAGDYSCVATKGSRRLRLIFSLRFDTQPAISFVEIVVLPGRDESLYIGGQVSRICSVRGNGWKVEWQSPSGKVSPGGQLTVNNLRSDQLGSYVCTARHTSGKTVKVVLILERSSGRVVSRMLSFRSEMGERLELGGVLHRRCEAPGPDWRVYWLLPTGSMRDGPVLRVDGLSERDTGRYECVAVRGYQRLSLSFRLRIATMEGGFTILKIVKMRGDNPDIGGSLQRECQINSPNWDVHWIKPNGQRVNGRYLFIYNLKNSDSGKYRCIAKHRWTSGSSLTAFFEIYMSGGGEVGSVTIKTLPGDQMVLGGRLVRQCVPPSGFGWNVYWITPSGTRINGQFLTIENLKPAISGMYTCHATNPSSGVTLKAMLKVKFFSQGEIPGGGGQMQIVKLPGERLTIGGMIHRKCVPPSSDWRVYWKKPDDTIVNSDVLSVYPIRMSDGGKYICYAENSRTGAKYVSYFIVNMSGGGSKRISLAIKELPGENLRVNGRIRRQCVVSEPGWTITWTTPDGRTIYSDILDIQRIQRRHGGKYACKAVKGQRTMTSYFTFTVSSVAKLTIQRLAETDPRMGGILSLRCDLPLPNYSFRWTLPNGKVIKSQYMRVTNLRIKDLGKYLCTARNDETGEELRSSFSIGT